MPTINDATVVASAYDTSGNGGRKLVRLSNGWLVAGAYNSASPYTTYLYKSVDNGQTWTQLCYVTNTNAGFSIVANGTKVYFIGGHLTAGIVFSCVFDATNVMNDDKYGSRLQFEQLQTDIGSNVSLAINDAGTELHAAWASKNSTYPNSFNIRYAKGTIAGDGSVTWGAVEQRYTDNVTNVNHTNPTIVVNSSNNPVIISQIVVDTNYGLRYLVYNGSSWSTNYIIYIATYAQSNPSAIFVPQRINGLANGEIHIVWEGFSSAAGADRHIYYSKSTDGGVTWTTALIIASTNKYQPSITANKNNQLFVVFDDKNSSADKITIATYNGTWSVGSNLAGGFNPSALFDNTFNFNFTSPLFIYKGASKVGFYGTWTVTTISVTQGLIGAKSDKSNLLTYTITTDGTMSTIIEKVNGTVTSTKTATSGQSLIAGLTQAQWDAIKYGKYKDATGGLNTLTVEMGSDVWTYTFDKRLATTDDIASAVKAVQDSQTAHLPSVKAKLASAIRGKGGTVNDTDSWDTIKTAIDTMPVKKTKSGTFTVSGASIAVTGLGFNPRLLSIKLNTSYYYSGNSDYSPNLYGMKNAAISNVTDLVRNADGFTIPLNATNYPNGTWTYEAEE